MRNAECGMRNKCEAICIVEQAFVAADAKLRAIAARRAAFYSALRVGDLRFTGYEQKAPRELPGYVQDRKKHCRHGGERQGRGEGCSDGETEESAGEGEERVESSQTRGEEKGDAEQEGELC